MLVSMRAFVLFGIVPDLKLAEKEGFEPSLQETCKPDFESGACDHSATSPFCVLRCTCGLASAVTTASLQL